MAVADATLFSSAIPEAQRQLVAHTALAERWLRFSMIAALDEVKYRLVGLTGLALLFARAGLPPRTGAVLAIVLSALVLYPLGMLPYFLGLDWSVPVALRELALHGAAGLLWGWLYWRHGWTAGLCGHVAAHAALQPLLSVI